MNSLIGITSDHAGYDLKMYLCREMKNLGFAVEIYGAPSTESIDYPDCAHPVAEKVASGALSCCIAICGTGNGMAMSFNRHANIRAALCWATEIAALARQHNNANVCVLPARFIAKEAALEIVKTFLSTDFEGGRHLQRINKIEIS